MSRSKQMDEVSYRAALRSLTSQGYDVSRFQKVPQYDAVADAAAVNAR